MNSWFSSLSALTGLRPPSPAWPADPDPLEAEPLSVPTQLPCRRCSESKPSLPQYHMAEVGEHWSPDSCWVVLYDFVYDITDFLSKHPGGSEILLEHGGRDATVPFHEVGHSRAALSWLKKYLIGELVEEERLEKSSTPES